MYKYLSNEKPNRERQPELDLAKFIAIILMIVCHCGIYFFEEGTTAYFVADTIGGEFGAPVFMFCMGIGVVFSHHNHPNLLIKRGAKILCFGYLLNFIRATIPEIIIWFINPSYAMFGIPASFYMIDILPFAGLALILMGLFKKWRIEPVYQVLLALLMAALGEILAGVSTGHEWLDSVCGLLWGTNDWSFFPLLNWFAFAAAGVFFGEILMHCNDKSALYIRLLPIGAIGVAISYYLYFTDPFYYPLGSYYYMGIKNVVLGLCYPILIFSVCYFVTGKTSLGENRFVLYCSTNLNRIYCISWVLILWTTYIGIIMLGWKITIITYVLLVIAEFILSILICKIWLAINCKRPKSA